MLDGVINVYKEKGYTSHDVVAKMRGILRQRKIGHTGTLDPNAQGVLPVCLGSGTKLCDMLTDETKTYETVLLLGRETDTQDTTGTVKGEYPVTVTEEEVRRAAEGFIGTYLQIPPMYSALKVNGKKLYELARAGKEISREARPVQISELAVLKIDLPRAALRITCSKGTYIRTLCYDIGKQLGCGGCMEELTRTRVGRFTLAESLTLQEIERLYQEGRISEKIISNDRMFSDLQEIIGNDRLDKLVHNGNQFHESLAETDLNFLHGEQVRVYDSKRTFIGIYEYDQGKQWFRPRKMFPEGR